MAMAKLKIFIKVFVEETFFTLLEGQNSQIMISFCTWMKEQWI